MVVYLSVAAIAEVAEYISANGHRLSREAIDFVVNLSRAHRKGCHLFVINGDEPCELIKALEANSLHAEARAVRHIYSKGLLARGSVFKSKVIITATSEGKVSIQPSKLSLSPRECTWQAPWHLFIDEMCAPSIVLGENCDDVKLAVKAGWLLHSSLKQLPDNTKIEYKLGGGDTTGVVIEEINNSNGGMALCLVDSDKTILSAADGTTAKKAISAIEQPNNRCALAILDAYSIENIIPVQFFHETNDVNYINAAAKHSALILKHGNSLWRSIPIKNGVQPSTNAKAHTLKWVNELLPCIDHDALQGCPSYSNYH